VYESDLPRIKAWLAADQGISEDHGFLLMSKEFTAECLDAVRRTLVPLIAGVKAT
jgi:hypothetical protein